MTTNSRKTGATVASEAARVLRDPNATREELSAAASALSQRAEDLRQTGITAASEAGRVLRDPKATREELAAAASTLSQTPSRKSAK